MIRSSIYSRTVRALGTNTTAYAQSDFNSDLNEALAIRTQQILRFGGYSDISQTHSTTDFVSITGLTEGQNGYNGEFALPTDLLDIERIEVTFDGASWHVISKENNNLYEMGQNPESEQDADSIKSQFSKGNPYAQISRGSVFIRPLNDGSTVTKGIHIYYQPRQADLATDSDAPEFEANLHQALIYDCAELEMIANPEKYDQLRERRILKKKEEVDAEFRAFYKKRLKISQQINTPVENFA